MEPIEEIAEVRTGRPPGYCHPGWRERFPWVVQGTTGRGVEGDGFDLGLWGTAPSGEVLGRWDSLRRATGMEGVVVARQVHGSGVFVHARAVAGLLVPGEGDGHATDAPGLLLSVTVADCVPVFLLDPQRRAVALLHAGWRGVAAGVLERGVQVMRQRFGSDPARVWTHLGPSICGACYEVGPEVHQALGLETPSTATPVDLREVLARRALTAGIAAPHLTRSTLCTRCSHGLYSHRRGDVARQAAYLGVRAGTP